MSPQKDEIAIWVTSKNQAWAAEMSGYSREEISRMYEEARAKGVVCTLRIKK